jgi:DNA-binding transcriptional ArsR family regulator
MSQIIELASVLKVCGHPLRLQILCAIVRNEESCVSELWNCLGQPQPVVSQHLAVLKKRGIVGSRVQGNKRVYSIINPFIEELVQGLVREETKTPG